MEVRVEYEYVASEPDELSLKKGDILTDVVQKLDGWWEGNLGSKRGLFPDNFVKVINTDPESEKSEDVFNDGVQLRKKSTGRKLKALFSYSPEQEDELALGVGDVLDFISEVEDGWFKGVLNGKTGIFPSNFVTDHGIQTTNGTAQDIINVSQSQNAKNRGTFIKGKGAADTISMNSKDKPSIDEDAAPKLPPKPGRSVRELARCFYPYPAQNEDELELNEGDIVTIISKNCEDEGWWRGELRGKTGLFPDNFVKLITSSDHHATATPDTAVPQQKMLPQGRNAAGILGGGDTNPPAKKSLPSPTTETSVVDGAASSKSKVDRDFSGTGNRKVSQIKEELKDLPIGLPPQKPMTPTSPSSPATGGFSYLSNVTLKATGKKELPPKKEQPEDTSPSEVGDFNAVERGEKLSHLTATRARAPKRRPPSNGLSRDSGEMENGLMNGDDSSLESSVDAPHHNSNSSPSNVIPNGGTHTSNNSMNSNSNAGGTHSAASTALVTDGSNLSTPGSRLSYSRDLDNTSTSSLNASGNSASTPTGAKPVPAKPAKLLPWMMELKQTQDKKRQNTGPVPSSTNVGASGSPLSSSANSSPSNFASTTSASPSSSPTPLYASTPTTTISGKEKEPGLTSNNFPPATKAPPLPAKPIIPPEKMSTSATSNNITANSNPVNTSSTISSVSLKLAGRKTPTVTASNSTGSYVNTTVSSAFPSSTSSVVNNGSNSHTPTTTTSSFSNNVHPTNDNAFKNASTIKGNANKPEFVSYEEHAKLKDKVYFLESELEAVKKQLKLLLERDTPSGHMV